MRLVDVPRLGPPSKRNLMDNGVMITANRYPLSGRAKKNNDEMNFLQRIIAMMFRSALLLFMIAVLAGCSGTVIDPEQSTDYKAYRVDGGWDAAEAARVLEAYFNDWVGTPYRPGGSDKRGIDCSGFVQQAYAALFDISLPRTTKMQARSGNKISQSELKATDLVFFKTGLFSKHVGIYRGDGHFMHASTKRGVSLSRLDDDYWNGHFWQARRIKQ